MNRIPIIIAATLGMLIFSCQTSTEPKSDNTIDNVNKPSFDLSEEFKQHWFDGKAEIASYNLSQMRYGEARKGQAVLIFVKEPFLKDEQVKANSSSDLSFDVMKLNATKTFNTGIYPYSIMQSTFSPLSVDEYPVKVSASTQEWCGQTYMQLNNREKFEMKSHSYFEGEADRNFSLNKQALENDIWIKLRIAPKQLKTGKMKVIPDFSYLGLNHQPIKAYQANLSQTVNRDTLVTTLKYNDLDRALKIFQSAEFPYTILKWQEIGENTEDITEATLLKSMRLKYWNKNANKFSSLRDSLKLN